MHFCYIVQNNKLQNIKISEVPKFLNKKSLWLDIENPTQDEVKFLEDNFHLHPLALEDSLKSLQTPKIEEYDDHCFIVARAFENSESSQLNFFLSKKYLVTIHLKPMKVLDDVRKSHEKNSEIFRKGLDFLVYSIIDSIVDEYFPIIDKLEDDIDVVEDEIFKSSNVKVLDNLFELKRKLLLMRRNILPLRDMLLTLTRREIKYIQPITATYLRDVYDHVIAILETIDISREMIAGGIEGYISSISNTLNIIMKKLTAITVIIMVPALIAGVYGMNFPNIPEFQWRYGYYSIIALMLSLVLILFIFFRKKGWI